MLVFEFFSGIGGMHQALLNIPEICPIKRIIPFDINTNANMTYFHNFGVKPFEISIESLSKEDYETICETEGVNEGGKKNLLWTMSPPCQPFTRQGNEKDLGDDRTKGLVHLVNLITETKYPPNFILLENVKNFEYSDSCALLKKALINRGYHLNEFLLSPNQIGVPNSRLRYYLLAKADSKFISGDEGTITNTPDVLFKTGILESKLDLIPTKISDFLNYDPEIEEVYKSQLQFPFYVTDKILSKESSTSIDIVTLESSNTCCFTKSYGRLLKGSGSFLLLDPTLYKENLNLLDLVGKIRHFTPEEIMRFMSFTKHFTFPESISVKSRYKLLGNSINVKVVTVLLNYLFTDLIVLMK